MKHFWLYLLMASVLIACNDSSTGSDSTPQEPEEQEPTKQPDPPAPTTCETMSCSHGCCDGKCVDLRSDPQHCGRCETKCDQVCLDSVCQSDCSSNGGKMCAGLCVDTTKNSDHCGRCNESCGPNQVCMDSKCGCESGYSDCDGNAANGCESEVGTCECTDGEIAECYWGDTNTKNVGICRAGTMICENGIFSFCENYVEPMPYEIPQNGLDDDCDGQTDELIDEDGDGYYYGYGDGMDCCDSTNFCSVENPALVNPSAIEIPGNGIDDNCNGLVDENPEVLCSTNRVTFESNKALGSEDAKLLARAIDICHDADKDGYGLVSAELLLADGTPLPATGNSSVCGSTTTLISPADQVAVATDLGGIVKPLNGTMAILSSGKAQGKDNTGFKDCTGTEVTAPAEFLAAHDGFLPVSETCLDDNTKPSHKQANDSIMLRLKLKAPSTAKGFNFRFKFFSKEYPAYVCYNYNDFFLALTNASGAQIRQDHNVSFDIKENPVSVNNAFFTECDPSACTKTKGCSDCKDGSDNVLAYVNDVKQAGATDWLKTSVPVNGGEEFTLDLIIFDAGDFDTSKGTNTKGYGHQRDSLVLIDNFEWDAEATTLQTVIN